MLPCPGQGLSAQKRMTFQKVLNSLERRVSPLASCTGRSWGSVECVQLPERGEGGREREGEGGRD